MIFQYIYVLNAVFLYSLLDGSNQVLCKKNRNGRRHHNRHTQDYFLNTEEREDFVDFRHRAGYESDIRKFNTMRPKSKRYRDFHTSNEESYKEHHPKQFQHPILIEDEHFYPLVTEDTPRQKQRKHESNNNHKKSHKDKSDQGHHRVSHENYKYNKKKYVSKSSESVSKTSEETKRVKESASSQETKKKFKSLKYLQKGTNLKQMLDIETLLNNPNIVHDHKHKGHAHHNRSSQEVQNGGEGNNGGPDNTGADNETTPSSQDLGGSQGSDANRTAILPTLPTTNIFTDNSSETYNTNPGYGDTYIYILLDPSGTAERHDLTCHPKIQMGNEIKTAPDKIYIKLYTRNNREEPEILKNVQNTNFKLRFSSTLQSFNFCKNKDLKVITHGHTNPAETLVFFEDLKDTYLDEYDVNVIIVDWKQISDSPYMLMSRLYEPVSMVLGHLLDALIKTYQYKNCIHLIGHGVGAHIMGYVSKFSKHEIYRITGLDPERPYFERPPSRKHALSKHDATFVDIIHTSKGLRGYAKSHGDVDFYPNEGISPQPNCTGETHTILEEDCSHFQALFYFKESIANGKDAFTARRCMVGACESGETEMGEHATIKETGNFYLKTNSKYPYARGKKDSK